jgi:hypothetical protein
MDRSSLSWAVGLTVIAWASIAQAACLGERDQIPAQTLAAFLASPAQILQQFPGGGALTAQVRDLVATDRGALPAAMAMLANADPDQKAAIGAGLGQAARHCLRTDPASEHHIRQAVAEANDRAVAVAFAAASEQPVGEGGGGLAVTESFGVSVIGGQADQLTGGPNSAGSLHVTGESNVSSSVSGNGGVSSTTTIPPGVGP